MERLPVHFESYEPETPKEHREHLKHVVVSFEESKESKEAPEKGLQNLITGLQDRLQKKYETQERIPKVIELVMTRDWEQLAKVFHFIDETTVADIAPEDMLEIDERGRLVFISKEGQLTLMQPSQQGPEISFYHGPMRPRQP